MKLYNRHRANYGFSDQGTQMTALVLFIVLLAFFIMLSGMTGFSKQNIDLALSSARAAFGVPDLVYFGGKADSTRPSIQNRSGKGNSLMDLGGVFQGDVPGVKAVFVKRTGVLQIDIPLSRMNQAMGIAPAGEPSNAIKALVAYLRDHPNRGYETTLTLCTRDGTSMPDGPMATEGFLAAWAARLVALGMAPKTVRVGEGVCKPGAVRLNIAPHAGQGAGL